MMGGGVVSWYDIWLSAYNNLNKVHNVEALILLALKLRYLYDGDF